MIHLVRGLNANVSRNEFSLTTNLEFSTKGMLLCMCFVRMVPSSASGSTCKVKSTVIRGHHFTLKTGDLSSRTALEYKEKASCSDGEPVMKTNLCSSCRWLLQLRIRALESQPP